MNMNSPDSFLFFHQFKKKTEKRGIRERTNVVSYFCLYK